MRERFYISAFVDRSIAGIVDFIREAVFSDRYALKDGLLQSLDPRAKLASLILLVAACVFSRELAVVCGLYALCLCLAGLSSIGLPFFLKRTWSFVPLFAVVIALPAVFSGITPGDPLFSFGLSGMTLTVTRQGALGALLFVCRVAVSVSFAILFSLTTGHTDMLKALRSLGVPQVFVMVFSMCHRFVYILLSIMSNTFTAVKSRVGGRVHYKKGQRLLGWNVAVLWSRSMRMNEDVYNAMLSRGYTGEPVMLRPFRARTRDWMWVAGCVLVFSLSLLLNTGRP